jgi:hypothetical protein
VLRPIAVIVSAILLSRPTIPRAEAFRYARALQAEAQTHDFDPLTGVAIIHFETRWNPTLVSQDGEDYGLAQIRARFFGACREDTDPVHSPSEGCRAAKAALLAGETNIHRMAVIISANRELCKAKTGTAHFPQWLAGYEGLSFPRIRGWCKPSAVTWRVVAYQRELALRLGPRKTATTRTARKAAVKASDGGGRARR